MNSLVITECTNGGEKINMIEICRIAPNTRQPRRIFDNEGLIALADSIRNYGILQPLSVRRTGNRDYELIAGERRLRAAQLLRMQRVPCIIVNADERSSAVMSIVENIQRQDLNIFEEANAIYTLKELYQLTQERIAASLSVSQSYVANKLRILRLSKTEQALIIENGMTERHCRALLRIDSAETRAQALGYMIKNDLNVSAAEEYVDRLLTEHGEEKRNREIKDIKVIYNSIDRTLRLAKSYGIDIKTEQTEEADCTRVTIIIPK